MAEAPFGVVEGDSLLTSAATGEAGFRFSEGAGGGVCGWGLLARVSALLSEAETECEVLAGEDRGKPSARSKGHASTAGARLECVPDLGVSVEEATGGECTADSQNARMRISTTGGDGIDGNGSVKLGRVMWGKGIRTPRNVKLRWFQGLGREVFERTRSLGLPGSVSTADGADFTDSRA